jgi:uncharacterized protein YecE (DUF72 family)
LELANRKGDWFAYWAQFFNTVEINSTIYRPPGELQVQSWIKKAKDLKGVEYSLKFSFNQHFCCNNPICIKPKN